MTSRELRKKEPIREIRKLGREVAQATGVTEKDVQKVLHEVGVRQLQELVREVAKSTRVAEKDVDKVLQEIGVAEVVQLTPWTPLKEVTVTDLRAAVQEALRQVML